MRRILGEAPYIQKRSSLFIAFIGFNRMSCITRIDRRPSSGDESLCVFTRLSLILWFPRLI